MGVLGDWLTDCGGDKKSLCQWGAESAWDSPRHHCVGDRCHADVLKDNIGAAVSLLFIWVIQSNSIPVGFLNLVFAYWVNCR